MTQMINTESNSGGVVNGGVAIPSYKQGNGGIGFPAQAKLPHGLLKKTALRDVQNQYATGAPNHQEKPSFLTGGSNKDAIKVCGTKRLTPELPSSAPIQPVLTKACANEQIMNANRRFDLELGKGKIQSSISKFVSSPQPKLPHQEIPEKQTQLKASAPAIPNNILHANSSFGALSGPNLLGKPPTRIQATQVDSVRVTSEPPSSADCNGTDELARTERFVRLQNFLKKCDESEYRDYLEMLRRLNPDQLSSHAKELESRVCKSNFDEVKEMRRTKCLEVLGKAPVTSDPSQATHQHLPRK